MSDPQKKGLFDKIGEDLGIDLSGIKAEFEAASKDFDIIAKEFEEAGIQVKKAAWDALSAADRKAAWLALKREELWQKYDMNDRLTGAGITAKFGLLAGPFAKIGIPVAMLVGFINGPKIVKTHDKWLDGHRADQGNMVANDDAPKSPGDGP